MHINEVKNNQFYQFPQWLLTEPYNKLSHRAMLVYMLLWDRRGLSEKNGWYDEDGRIYVHYTNEKLTKRLNCSEPAIIKSKKELAEIGLMDEVRQGVNKPNRLYINGTKNSLVQDFKNIKHGTKNSLVQDLKNIKGSHTNIINTNISNINNITNSEVNPLKKIAYTIKQNWGKDLTPIELETMTHMLTDYPLEIVEFAISEATLRNKKTVRWVDSSCRDWYIHNNLETITAIQDYLLAKKSWSANRNYSPPEVRQTNVPDWSKEPVKTERTVEGQAELAALSAELEEMANGIS